MKTARGFKNGFTLVELLVVIAIIAILAAVVVLIINPLELIRRGRDSTRLSDLGLLQSAIGITTQEATAASVLCGSAGACTGTVLRRDSLVGGAGRLTNGTGWVAVDLGAQTAVSIATLPVDPTNTAGVAGAGAGAGYHYTYCAQLIGGVDVYKIETNLESVQYNTTQDKDGLDGGQNIALYEVGNTNLSTFACTY